jgi:hypothetical protein
LKYISPFASQKISGKMGKCTNIAYDDSIITILHILYVKCKSNSAWCDLDVQMCKDHFEWDFVRFPPNNSNYHSKLRIISKIPEVIASQFKSSAVKSSFS